MSESYRELLVKRKNTAAGNIAKIVFGGGAGFLLAFGFMQFSLLMMLAGIILAVVAYFVFLNTDLEYEYLYLDKELTIDKVMAKTKRKKVATFDIEKLEILAPVNSHHLDSYNSGSRKYKTEDYSANDKSTQDERYVMIYEGSKKVFLQIDKDFAKLIYSNAPRKVFFD